MSVDFDREIAAIAKRVRAAEDDYRHARLYDIPIPNGCGGRSPTTSG
jgi:hypothetical protein